MTGKAERLWRVVVNRYTSPDLESPPSKERLGLIVSAESSDAALNIAEEYYENNGTFGPILYGVEAVEAASIELPLEILV